MSASSLVAPTRFGRVASLVLAVLVMAAALTVTAAPAAAQSSVACPAIDGLELANQEPGKDGDGNETITCTYNASAEDGSKVRLTVFWTQDDTATDTPADCQFDTTEKDESGKLTVRIYSATKAANSRYVISDTSLAFDRPSVEAGALDLLAQAEAVAIECGELPTGSTTTTAAGSTTTSSVPDATTTTVAASDTTVAATDTSGGTSSAVQVFVVGFVVLVLAGLGGYLWYSRRRGATAAAAAGGAAAASEEPPAEEPPVADDPPGDA
jgi:hypothetical protein